MTESFENQDKETTMKDIDKMIRDALGVENAELFESLAGEQGIQEVVIDSFRDKTRWMVTLAFVAGAAVVVLAVVADLEGLNRIDAAETR